jgi:ABC-type dipeptide/oligopeptide/nickel transport system permease subunit
MADSQCLPPALVEPVTSRRSDATQRVGQYRHLLTALGTTGIVALVVLLLMTVTVVLGPLAWTADPNRTQLTRKFAPPSAEAPLGRDELGRDLLARLLHGGRLSLPAAILVTLGTSGIGLLAGSLAGALGGRTDAALSRLVDGLLTLPSLVVALAIVGVLGKSFVNLLLALILTGWPWYARAYRGLVVREREQAYVLAARSVGAHTGRIVTRHILPNVVGPTLVLATTNLGNAILGLTALSFLGLGVQPPQAEWGAMINGARGFFDTQPWVTVAPGLAISITVLAVNVLGDALRDALDPRRF